MLLYYIFSSIYTYMRFILLLQEENETNFLTWVFYVAVSLVCGMFLLPIDIAKLVHKYMYK
jgi:hypothetical protein